MGVSGSSKASTCLTCCATCSSVRCAGCLVAPPSSFTAASPCAQSPRRVPPAAPPATDDHRHVDQVLVVLVAEEALAQLGQPALSALQSARASSARCAAGCSRWARGAGCSRSLGRPQAQVGVVVLARPGQLPVRVREQCVGPRAALQVQHDGTIRPRRARAPPSAASVICCRCLAQLAILFLRAQFFFV